jgi:hypothetical protein
MTSGFSILTRAAITHMSRRQAEVMLLAQLRQVGVMATRLEAITL